MPELQKPVQPQPVEKPIEPEKVNKPEKSELLKYAFKDLFIKRRILIFFLSLAGCFVLFYILMGKLVEGSFTDEIVNFEIIILKKLALLYLFAVIIPVILCMIFFAYLPVKKLVLKKLKSFNVSLVILIISLVLLILLIVSLCVLQFIIDSSNDEFNLKQFVIGCLIKTIIFIVIFSPCIILVSIDIVKTKKFRNIAGSTTPEQFTAEFENYNARKLQYKQYLKNYRAYMREVRKAERQDKKNLRAYNAEMELYNTRVAKTSLFTGGAFAWFGVKLLALIITLFSLGIAYPFAVCFKLKWQAEHTYIGGRKQCFDGNGAQLFGKYILWWLLSLITLGIYYVLCAKVNILKWETSHTHFEGEEGNSVFDGKWYQLYGVNMLTRFVTLITLSFGQFWAHCYKLRWEYKHKTIDGYALKFDGTAMQYFGKRIVWLLLTIITLGIYSFWLSVKSMKWTISHTSIIEPVSATEISLTDAKEETKSF